ncbi:EF-hand domain-containing protein [Roseibium sp.]|uniref:EF-hand domain-containing protein n=1 Tax=Roseibium sp. TaxID=1936156 RepID=UPI003A96DDA6
MGIGKRIAFGTAIIFLAGAVTGQAQESGTGNGPVQAQPRGYGPGYGMMSPGYGMMGPGYGMMGPGYGMWSGMMMPWHARGPMAGIPGRGRFAMIDANEDGMVSAEEAASAADDVFSAMDYDDDGALTLDEYLYVRMGPGDGWNQARQEARQKEKSDRFAAIDEDGDGKVSKEEFLAGAKAHHEAADTNGDGQVSPWEHRSRNWN